MSRKRTGPRGATERLRHLLVMLPWLMERGEVPLAEVAQRFGVPEAQVAKDLELVAMCGLPPYVDEMVDVFIDDGMVFVGVPRLFTRSLRLTAPEGFSLLAAGRAAMELPGADPDGPLARGLAKLAEALDRAGLDTATDAGVAVDLDRPPLTDDVVEAITVGAELTIDYFSPQRGETTSRTIVPRRAFVEGEHWYVLADDERSGGRRTFRIDRIESLARTGVTHEVDHEVEAPDEFFVDVDVPRATLRLKTDAQWIVERYPTDSVDPASGRGVPAGAVDVTLPVASDWWLHRLLVRLGPSAKVVTPVDAADGARDLAAAILANYR